MQEERCHMIQNTQSITIINQRDIKHFSSSISGQRRDFQVLNLPPIMYMCESLVLFVPFHKQQYWWWWWWWWWCVSVWQSQCVCTVSPAQLVSSRTLYMFLPSHLHSLAVRKNFILWSLIFSWKRSKSLNFHFCRIWQVRVRRMKIYTCKYKRGQITFVGNRLFVQRNSLRLKVSWSPYPKVPRSSDSLTANF